MLAGCALPMSLAKHKRSAACASHHYGPHPRMWRNHATTRQGPQLPAANSTTSLSVSTCHARPLFTKTRVCHKAHGRLLCYMPGHKPLLATSSLASCAAMLPPRHLLPVELPKARRVAVRQQRPARGAARGGAGRASCKRAAAHGHQTRPCKPHATRTL